MSFCRVGKDLARSESIGPATVCGLYLKEPGHPAYPPCVRVMYVVCSRRYTIDWNKPLHGLMRVYACFYVWLYVSVRLSQAIHLHEGYVDYIINKLTIIYIYVFVYIVIYLYTCMSITSNLKCSYRADIQLLSQLGRPWSYGFHTDMSGHWDFFKSFLLYQ